MQTKEESTTFPMTILGEKKAFPPPNTSFFPISFPKNFFSKKIYPTFAPIPAKRGG
jgi:hypothetical protein